MSLIETPISVGELIDKITILEIKAAEIRDAGKLANVRTELDLLAGVAERHGLGRADLAVLKADLAAINRKLWVIEDDIREHEARGDFGESFIALARAVYVTNDERARVKKAINLASGSALTEEKSYYGS